MTEHTTEECPDMADSYADEIEDEPDEPTRKSQTVEIKITDGHNFAPGTYDGSPFIAVDYFRGGQGAYGGSSPCRTEDEVKGAIRHAEDVIRKEGDTPEIKDIRKRNTLAGWLE